MGVKIFDLVEPEHITFKDLDGKILVFDASLTIFQFLSTIRQADGSLLTDSHGNVTSHLVGLFSRMTNFMQKGMKLVFVFDGKPPELKKLEQERRRELKKEAHDAFEKAKEEHDVEAMKKFAARTSKLDSEMLSEAKALLDYLGIPVIQAPSEADAQIAHMVKKGDCYAAVTQDADVMMFGATKIVRNLSASLKKKSNVKYQNVQLELIKLADVLNSLGIDLNQFTVLCILVGTDYNIGGIKGIGAKKALQLVKRFGYDFDALFKEVKWNDFFDYPWTDVYDAIKNMPVIDDYKLDFKSVNKEKIVELLCVKHGFDVNNVNAKIEKLVEYEKENKPKTASLNKWFGK